MAFQTQKSDLAWTVSNKGVLWSIVFFHNPDDDDDVSFHDIAAYKRIVVRSLEKSQYEETGKISGEIQGNKASDIKAKHESRNKNGFQSKNYTCIIQYPQKTELLHIFSLAGPFWFLWLRSAVQTNISANRRGCVLHFCNGTIKGRRRSATGNQSKQEKKVKRGIKGTSPKRADRKA